MKKAMAVEAFSELPDTAPTDTSEHVEEYTDDQGRKVKRVVKKTVIKTTTAKGLSIDKGDEPEEQVEEFIDEQGRKVRRVTKRIVKRVQV